MNKFLKNIILGFAILCSLVAKANDPGIDLLKDTIDNIPAIENSIQELNKVDAKEVKHVFLKKKRIDKIFTPKKKLSRKKYTIA